MVFGMLAELQLGRNPLTWRDVHNFDLIPRQMKQ
jgi:hypothetical protein